MVILKILNQSKERRCHIVTEWKNMRLYALNYSWFGLILYYITLSKFWGRQGLIIYCRNVTIWTDVWLHFSGSYDVMCMPQCLRELRPVRTEPLLTRDGGGGGGQVLPGEVCGGVSSCSEGRWSTACQPNEPQSLPGGATRREPGAGLEAADCQVRLGERNTVNIQDWHIHT